MSLDHQHDHRWQPRAWTSVWPLVIDKPIDECWRRESQGKAVVGGGDGRGARREGTEVDLIQIQHMHV